MNTFRLSTLSLTLAIAVITLGYANSSFAGPDCAKHPTHASCDGGNGSSALFSVEVFLEVFLDDHDVDDVDDGNVTVTKVKITGNRQSLNGTMASPHLDLIDLPCGMLGHPILTQFAISTAKIPPSSDSLTYFEAAIYDFTAFLNDVDARVFLSFVIDDPDDLNIHKALFPTVSGNAKVFFTGTKIGVGISPDHGSCSGEIDQDWTITVTMD